jgi:hypothetical protein
MEAVYASEALRTSPMSTLRTESASIHDSVTEVVNDISLEQPDLIRMFHDEYYNLEHLKWSCTVTSGGGGNCSDLIILMGQLERTTRKTVVHFEIYFTTDIILQTKKIKITDIDPYQ